MTRFTRRQARIIRHFRKIHRYTGIFLAAAIILMAVSGILLGWKKSSNYLQAESRRGVSQEPADWLSLDSLQIAAIRYLDDSVSAKASPQLDRIYVYTDKGMVKFVFTEGFYGIQLDATTGTLLTIERRRADFIEMLHDGSIIDHYLQTGNAFKLIYTTVLGLAFVLFVISGIWMWYGPKRIRQVGSRKS